MQYWLIKSEPNAYGWDDLITEHETQKPHVKITSENDNIKNLGMWDGVRNHAAAKNMRAMQLGDQAFFYHSQIGLEIVGIAEVTREHYIDPTDPKGKFVAVNFKPVCKLGQSVTLKAIKANPKLADMPLVRQSRLSVSAVSADQWAEIISMSED